MRSLIGVTQRGVSAKSFVYAIGAMSSLTRTTDAGIIGSFMTVPREQGRQRHRMDNQLDTLIHLDTRLRTRLLTAIIARWRAGERDITSHDLYAQLLEAGEDIPVGAMAVVFDNLRMLKLISGPFPENSLAIRIHGDTRITWLHPRLFADPTEP